LIAGRKPNNKTSGAVFGLPRFILRYSYIGEKIKKIFFEKNIAVLTVLTVLFSKTVDIQQTQKTFKVPPKGTSLIQRRYLLQGKIKIGLSASNIKKNIF